MNTLKSHSLTIAVLLGLFFGSGCFRSQRVASDVWLSLYHVSVRPSCDGGSTDMQIQYQPDGNEVVFHEFNCGDTRVLIRGNTLFVNGKSYGTLNELDKVTVDYGKVRVNSKVRAEVR